jgi:hypothetical protein
VRETNYNIGVFWMNEVNVWKLLDEKRLQYPEDFGQPFLQEDEINRVQIVLGVYFSEQYLRFIRDYGNASLPGHTVYGMYPLKDEWLKTVLDKTLFYRNHQKWPGIEDWYIVSDDGFGNPMGVDPEGKVWLSDHDSGFEKVKLADDFEEFLYRVYTETLYE